MVKKSGRPEGHFELNVDEGAFGEPAHLPDYLDRNIPTVSEPEPRRRGLRQTEPGENRPEASPQQESREVEEESQSRKTQQGDKRTASRRAKRKELSIDAETARMIERVVGGLQEMTPQKNATASEFARSIIQLAEECRHHQDFTHVKRRGQWGSPTARAFVADIKKGFLSAIGRHFIDRYRQEAVEYLRETNESSE